MVYLCIKLRLRFSQQCPVTDVVKNNVKRSIFIPPENTDVVFRG